MIDKINSDNSRRLSQAAATNATVYSVESFEKDAIDSIDETRYSAEQLPGELHSLARGNLIVGFAARNKYDIGEDGEAGKDFPIIPTYPFKTHPHGERYRSEIKGNPTVDSGKFAESLSRQYGPNARFQIAISKHDMNSFPTFQVNSLNNERPAIGKIALLKRVA